MNTKTLVKIPLFKILLLLSLLPYFTSLATAQCRDPGETCSPDVPRLVKFGGVLKDLAREHRTGTVAITPGGFPRSAFVEVSPTNSSQMKSESDGETTSPSAGMVESATARIAAVSTVQSVAIPSTDAIATHAFSASPFMVNSQTSYSRSAASPTNPSPNILFADQFAGGVPDAVKACPSPGCVIYADSGNVNRNLGTVDPGNKAITLYLGPFTYNVNQIILESELRIIGMGSGATFLQSVSGNQPVIAVAQALNGVAINVQLSGLRLIGAVGNTSQDGILWDSSGFANSGVWYSELNDIFITGFAGNGIHLVGANSNYSGMSEFVEFNRVIVFRPHGGGNGLRIEGAAYELYFNDCEIDGTAPGDGTNIFIGARPGNAFAIPTDINFRGLTSQSAATAVQIDGGWALSFYSPHHEGVWGVYSVTGDLGAALAGLTISDAGFQTSGANNGAGYLLSVTTSAAWGIRFIHNHIMSPPDAVVLASNGAGIVYRDNLFFGGTNLPATSGITTQLASAPSINIGGVHTVALTSSTTPITTIMSGLGPGEMVTFFTVNGPVTFGAGGNINLMGLNTVTLKGSITFIVSDLAGTPSWVPVSQWPTRFAGSPAQPSPIN
jgi:hypothetical protein